VIPKETVNNGLTANILKIIWSKFVVKLARAVLQYLFEIWILKLGIYPQGFEGGAMKKVSQGELYILKEAKLDRQVLQELIAFNRKYQDRILRYFAEMKIDFEKSHPGVKYPGLFAEVDSISGKMRPTEDQKVWSWGDCRGLGIWSYLIAKGVIPDEETEIYGRKLNLRNFFSEYCDFIYLCLKERYELNGGRIPFIVDVLTNKASNDPANVPCAPGECEPTHVFAADGFMQYGIMKGNKDSLELGLKFLDESIVCGMNFRNVDHITKKRNPYNGHGFIMVTLGAIIDTLKCMEYRGASAVVAPGLKEKLLRQGFMISEFILHNFCNPETGHFWEYNCKEGNPYITPEGYLISDPGHVSEACGFIAELETMSDEFKFKFSSNLVKIMRSISDKGYSKAGIMFKNIDLLTGAGLYDKADAKGRKHRTSPWWNVRECCAATMKLFEITGDNSCLEMYRKAQNATYLNFPNEKIGGLMVQTLDADTLKPLPFFPATGNLDPMHDTRAREREIEAMERLLAKTRG